MRTSRPAIGFEKTFLAALVLRDLAESGAWKRCKFSRWSERDDGFPVRLGTGPSKPDQHRLYKTSGVARRIMAFLWFPNPTRTTKAPSQH